MQEKKETAESPDSSGSLRSSVATAAKWIRLSCHDFEDNQIRLQLFAMAYNIGNFLRRLALPKSINDWSLRTMREKLIKIGAKVVSHARYVTFQMAEVLVSKSLFHEILERIKRLKPVPIGYNWWQELLKSLRLWSPEQSRSVQNRFWKKCEAQKSMYSCQFSIKLPQEPKSLKVQGDFDKIVDTNRRKLCLLGV